MLYVGLNFNKPRQGGILQTKFFLNSILGSFFEERKWRNRRFGILDRLLAQQNYKKHSDEHKQGAKSTVF
jgi:hypothetical protein